MSRLSVATLLTGWLVVLRAASEPRPPPEVDLGARLALTPPCRFFLLPGGQGLDCPRARLPPPGLVRRLHLVAVSPAGTTMALLELAAPPQLGPAPTVPGSVKRLEVGGLLSGGLPAGSLYRSPSACVASVLTGEPLTHFYPEELENLLVKPICNGTLPITVRREDGEEAAETETEVHESSVPGGGLAELSELEGLIVPANSSEPLDLPRLSGLHPDTLFSLVRRPRRGSLTIGGRPVSSFTYRQIDQGEVVYNNMGNCGSDHLLLQFWDLQFVYPIYILPTNQTHRRTTRSVGSVTRIRKRNNSTHKVDHRSIDLNENGLMELTNRTLRLPARANDTFVVETGPKHGRILVRGEPASKFSMGDLTNQVVVFEHNGKETGHSTVRDKFRLLLRKKSKEEPFDIEVNIHPIDDSPPRVRIEGGIRVKEGGRAKLSPRQIKVEDPDTKDEDITCHIIAEPLFGHVRVSDKPSAVFNYAQLKSGHVFYTQSVNAGLEPREDGFSVACFDIENNTESSNNFGLISVSIDNVNDEPPSISPKLIHVPKGGEVVLDKELICPKDADTSLEKLTFKLASPPSKGVVMRKLSPTEYQGVRNFTYTQMDEVYYRSGTEVGEDNLTLVISDGDQESNAVVKFVVQAGDSPPEMMINEGLEINEGADVLITEKILFAEDADTSPEKIVYILRDPPLFGNLLLAGTELAPNSKFSQQSISSGQLSYRHMDASSSMDVFVFDLTDGKNTLFNQNFFITIHTINQSYPIITSDTIVIPPLGSAVITSDVLRLKNAEDVEFHVMSPPRQGRLEFRGKSEPIQTFTYKDIDDENIQYVHLKNVTIPEIIQFEVSDGKNSIFHTLNINFTNENSQFIMSAEAFVSEELTEETITTRPTVVTNNPVRSLTRFNDGSVGAVITRRHLLAEEEGQNITYVIADPPKYGNLFNKRTNNTCGNFTQDDLNSGRLMYFLKPGIKVPGDAVLLNVLGQGLPLKGLQFTLEWSWVHFKSNFTVVDETSGSLKVELVRWGSLAESAFVGVERGGGNGSLEDGTAVEDQVQFGPGQNTATLTVLLQDDQEYEGLETISFALARPYNLLIDEPSVTVLAVHDPEDRSNFSFETPQYRVTENVKTLKLPITRSGDSNSEAKLTCVTENGEAEGGEHLDFLPQPSIPTILKFAKGENRSYCTVTVYDDDIMEPEEDFWVKLRTEDNVVISRAHVSIVPDEADYPTVSFEKDSMSVHENSGEAVINIIVNGTREIVNASIVVLASSMSAKANKDFVFPMELVTITPDVDKYQVTVKIIDDNKAMVYEGMETFLLSLSEPRNCVLGLKSVLAVTIEDESDVPVFQFAQKNYSVDETAGHLEIEIERVGDVMGEYNVICTAQGKSASSSDFSLPPNGTFQHVTFFPGEVKKSCRLIIKDDNIYESPEELTLRLKTAEGKVRIGERSEVDVTITDEEDKETIAFGKTHYFIKEPLSVKENVTVRIEVTRKGDTTNSSKVRIYTKNGSAKSGEDYVGKSADMSFEPGQSSFTCEIKILFDKEVEIKEYFTIYLEVLNEGGTAYSKKSVIYIYDAPHPSGVMFPAPPVVYPSTFFEDNKSDRNYFVQGYPLICLSVCSKGHYLHEKFELWCKKHGVREEKTVYSWQIEDNYGRPIDIPFPIFFANTSSASLEPVYARGGARLRCLAAPLLGGVQGKSSYSEVVEVSKAPGLCPSPKENMMGAEPFIAQISYTEDAKEKVKLIKISVTIPHYDGLFPAISTHLLGDAFQILRSYTPRAEVHKCSNIVTPKELRTRHGFIETNGLELKKLPLDKNSWRGEDALNIYRHLDVESCVWRFESYYTLDEAVNSCGASVSSESNLFDTERTSVTLQLPLYVSYYTYSVFGWQHTDTSILLRLTFLYEGSALSDEGVVREEEETLEGSLHPTSMHISTNGSLVVYFKTTTHFPGHFLLRSTDGLLSSVHSLEHPEMPITLKMTGNRSNPNGDEQYWVFHSDFTDDDYTGRYEVSLVPCVLLESMDVCSPRKNIIFPLDIHLQQISDPVHKKYTLNTSFHLVKKREAKQSIEETSLFEPGDQVFGFIKMEPPERHLELWIDQCYVCSGRNGRTPRYNPKKKEFGCLMESPDLQYSVKIIDTQAPGTSQKTFHELDFNATLIRKNDNHTIVPLLDANNLDIFYFDITPLFSLKSAKVWFIHCTFTIRSAAGERRLARRSAETETGSWTRGTNMRRLVLQDESRPVAKQVIGRPPQTSSLARGLHLPQPALPHLQTVWLASVLFVLTLSLVLTLVLLCYIVHVKKELSAKRKTPFSNVNYRECSANDFNY